MTSPSKLTRFIAVGLALGSIGLASAIPALAQSRTRRSRVKFTMPRLSYDRGAPSKRGDGASRSDFCGAPNGPVAITPQYSEVTVSESGNAVAKHFVLTQTSDPKPTFGLHLPLGKQDLADLQLTLFVEDLAGNPIYDLPIVAPEQAGMITFKPNSSQPNLEEGQRYNWAIEIEALCFINGVEQPKFIALTGQIEHRAMFSENVVMTPEDYAIVAAEKGFWPDAMSTVADLHRANRSDEQYIADWSRMLEDIGLEQLTTAQLSDVTQLLPPQIQTRPAESANITVQPQRPSSRLFPVR